MDPRVGRVQQARVHDRRADRLAVAGAVAVVERGGDGDRREQRVAGVAHVRAAPQRRVAGVAGAVLPLGAGERRRRLVGAREVGARALLVAARVAVDEPREALAQRLVVDAEPGGRAGPPVRRDDVGALDEAVAGSRGRVRPSRLSEMLRLPRLVPRPMWVPAQNGVVQGVDLDHVGAEVGEHRPANGPATPSPRSITRMPASGCAGPAGPRPARARPRAAASARTSAVCWPGRGAAFRTAPGRRGELEHRTDVPDAADLGIVDLDDAAVGQERLVGQRLGRGANEGDPHQRLGAGRDPLVGRELLERLGELRVQEDARQHPVGLHRHPVGVVAVRGVEPDGGELVALGRRQHPARPDRPVVDPPPVGALVETLDRARVDGPHPVERRVGVLDPLPVQAHRGERALQQRRLDPLTLTRDLARSQRGGDAERREVHRADARPRRAREDRARAVGAAHPPSGGRTPGAGPDGR